MGIKYDITFHPSWWYKNAGIQFTQDFFDDPKYRIECDMKMRKTLYEHFGEYGIGEKNPQERPIIGSDLLAAGYLYSQIMGCDIIYKEDNSPQVVCCELDEDTIEEVEAVDLDSSLVWQATQKQIDYLLDKYGRVEPHINLMGIQNIAMDIMGQELMVSYYTAEDEVDELLGKITDLSIEIGRRLKKLSPCVSAGVTAITKQTVKDCYLTSNCSVEMISNKLYEQFLLKYDMKLAREFKNFGIHHCGQSMEHVVEGYAKIPELTFAEVGAGSDMKAVRKALPDVFLNARYSPARLMTATENEIFTEVEQLVSDGDNSSHKISVSCVGIDGNVTDEKIVNFLRACQNVHINE